ncbi:unnamed protein product [Litomosoides sigmodontis]|uniref:Granulins domain-containing protein n=1 Tax=Litomosoides sigmodontis TaxID=42156 RepID=A0A3P6U1F8_LITSI|nr:unnamed protein product [Litomosoides sigmodontis]
MLSVFFLITVAASVKVLIAHTCPGSKSMCPDTATCCLIGASVYGCCPMIDAVCCDDRTHCCPANTKCDMVHRRCLRNEFSISPTNKRAKHLKGPNITKNKQFIRICSGGNSSCTLPQTILVTKSP